MNKQTIYLCVAELLAFSVIAACGVNKSHEGKSEEIADFEVVERFKTLSRDYRCIGNTMKYDDTKELYTSVSVSVQWPEKLGNVDISAMQDSIVSKAFGRDGRDINKIILEYAEMPEGYDLYELTDVAHLPEPSDSVKLYYRSTSVTIEALTEQMAVVKCETSAYTGGAHDSYMSNYMTFDLGTGKARIIGLWDLFERGSEAELLKVIKSMLMAKYDVDTVGALNDAGIFSDSLYVTDDVYVDGYDVVFHYDPYEIGPWAMGVIDVEVPYYAVAEILTPMGREIFMGD